MLFISSLNLFSFSRYLNFYIVFGHVGNTAFTLSETILSEVTEGKTYYKKEQKSFFVS